MDKLKLVGTRLDEARKLWRELDEKLSAAVGLLEDRDWDTTREEGGEFLYGGSMPTRDGLIGCCVFSEVGTTSPLDGSQASPVHIPIGEKRVIEIHRKRKELFVVETRRVRPKE